MGIDKEVVMLVAGRTVAFVPARDLERADHFYVGLLGLTRKSRDDYGLVVEGNGVEVRIAAAQEFTPQPFTILGFDVSDVTGTARALAEKGVKFRRYPGMEQDADAIWRAPSGSRIAWFGDPDDNVLSIAQHPA
ncbi:MAG TPA: VOC family protein [Polyangiaceae bacterium]|nr:VOC family protein [Polyangiaceae bacterium]